MAIEKWTPRWGLMRWNPARELEEMDRYLGDMLGDTFWPSLRMRTPEIKAWMPALDVFERDDKFVVKAEIPGMDEENINVSVEGNSLVIKGQKDTEKEVKDEDYYHCERSYGSFYRSVPLPSTVDKDKIQADYDNGILEVTFPKSAEVKPKKVKVTASSKKARSVKAKGAK
ncbi:MAG: Hsp20/alpha crystallin family protein [Dehalococcoidia bacterium]|nr:Hsp20/alpha crystallin family protein [Dehalococcoidia bacterium]